jgi:hypothetical protein
MKKPNNQDEKDRSMETQADLRVEGLEPVAPKLAANHNETLNRAASKKQFPIRISSSTMRRMALGSLAACGLALLFLQPTGADERAPVDDPRPDVLSKEQVLRATGKTLAEWGAKWWQWAFEHPEVLSDTTGEFGHLGDVGGPVFFAEGSGGDPLTLRYSVPGGQYILLPVATYIWTLFDPCAEVDCAREIVNHNFLDGITDVSVRIDGHRLRHISEYLVRVPQRNPLFKVDAGPIQPDGYGGIMDAVQGGYWVMLEPLPPGRHEISLSATVPNLDPFTGESLGGYIDLDATLLLRAQPRRGR